MQHGGQGPQFTLLTALKGLPPTFLRILQTRTNTLHCLLHLLTLADIELDGSQSVTLQAVQLLDTIVPFILGGDRSLLLPPCTLLQGEQDP